MIKIIGDYHIHTKFSDGKSDTDTVIAAVGHSARDTLEMRCATILIVVGLSV